VIKKGWAAEPEKINKINKVTNYNTQFLKSINLLQVGTIYTWIGELGLYLFVLVDYKDGPTVPKHVAVEYLL
jgi:hypothetical protein